MSAAALAWFSFWFINLLIYWHFPRMDGLRPVSFARQAKLIEAASGGRLASDRVTCAPKEGEAADKVASETSTNASEQVAPGSRSPRFDALSTLAVASFPGAFRCAAVDYQDFEQWPQLCRLQDRGFKSPFDEVTSLFVTVYGGESPEARSEFCLKRKDSGIWEPTENDKPTPDSWKVGLKCTPTTTAEHVGALSKRWSVRTGNDACTQIVLEIGQCWVNLTNGVNRDLGVDPEVNDFDFIADVELKPVAAPEGELDIKVSNVRLAPHVRTHFPDLGSNSVGEQLRTIAILEKQDHEKMKQSQMQFLDRWGNCVTNTARELPKTSEDVHQPLFPFSGTVPSYLGDGRSDFLSLVWFDQRSPYDRFVAQLHYSNGVLWGRSLTVDYYLIRGTTVINPDPNPSATLFWQAPAWWGWRPCGYDASAEQLANRFFSLYKQTALSYASGADPKSSAPVPKREVERVARWLEAAMSDQLWFSPNGETEPEAFDPLNPDHSVDAFSAIARRLNGSDRWGLIQVLIVICFWYGIVSLKYGHLKDRLRQSDLALEAMPLLGFLGTVVGISNALIGSGGILSETLLDKQLVVSNMTQQLATAFDTTFLAICGTLALILIRNRFLG